MFLDKTLYSICASLHSWVQIGTGEPSGKPVEMLGGRGEGRGGRMVTWEGNVFHPVAIAILLVTYSM